MVARFCFLLRTCSTLVSFASEGNISRVSSTEASHKKINHDFFDVSPAYLSYPEVYEKPEIASESARTFLQFFHLINFHFTLHSIVYAIYICLNLNQYRVNKTRARIVTPFSTHCVFYIAGTKSCVRFYRRFYIKRHSNRHNFDSINGSPPIRLNVSVSFSQRSDTLRYLIIFIFNTLLFSEIRASI